MRKSSGEGLFPEQRISRPDALRKIMKAAVKS
jgi:hypothetical protein